MSDPYISCSHWGLFGYDSANYAKHFTDEYPPSYDAEYLHGAAGKLSNQLNAYSAAANSLYQKRRQPSEWF